MVKVEFFFLIIPLLSLIFLAQAEISHLEVQPAQAQFLTAYREFQLLFQVVQINLSPEITIAIFIPDRDKFLVHGGTGGG